MPRAGVGEGAGTDCNLIGCLCPKFWRQRENYVKKDNTCTIIRYHHYSENELATMLLMVPEPRETPELLNAVANYVSEY